MTSTLLSNPAAQVLDDLFADAARQQASVAGQRKVAQTEGLTPFERFTLIKDSYLPIDRPFGNLLYSLIRGSNAQCVVEFGTSFGISTIYLAAAVHDNGAGQVVTSEFIVEKATRAKENLTAAGMVDVVEFRVGDAIETLAQPLPGPVDLLFLDGDKGMYLPILQLLEPRLKPGCLVVSDNTDLPGTQPLLDYVRDPAHGYLSVPVLTTGGDKAASGHEISVRL